MMTNKLTYRQWMQAVDKIVERRTGLDMGMLPDWMSRDCYESGADPQTGADDCLEVAGYDEGVLVDEL